MSPQENQPAGFGMCDGCGSPLTDREMLHGDICESCIDRDADDFWEQEDV